MNFHELILGAINVILVLLAGWVVAYYITSAVASAWWNNHPIYGKDKSKTTVNGFRKMDDE